MPWNLDWQHVCNVIELLMERKRKQAWAGGAFFSMKAVSNYEGNESHGPYLDMNKIDNNVINENYTSSIFW